MTVQEYDARWAADAGCTIDAEAEVDEHCAPACTSDFHLC